MRSRLRALTALALSGLLVMGVTATVSAEGLMDSCYVKKDGDLRKATDVKPCDPKKENTVRIQIGEPKPGMETFLNVRGLGGGANGTRGSDREFATQSRDGYTDNFLTTLSVTLGARLK